MITMNNQIKQVLIYSALLLSLPTLSQASEGIIPATKVLGMSASDATLELMINGFSEVKIKTIPVCTKQEGMGQVVYVVPNNKAPDDEITIVVKVEGALVPNIKGLTTEDAKTKLEVFGFKDITGLKANARTHGVVNYKHGTCLQKDTVLVVELEEEGPMYVSEKKCNKPAKPMVVLRAGDDSYHLWQGGKKKERPAYVTEKHSLVATFDWDPMSPYFLSLFLDETGAKGEIRAICKKTLGLMNKTKIKFDGLDGRRAFLGEEAVVVQTGDRELVVWEISGNRFRNFFTSGDIGDFSIGMSDDKNKGGLSIPILLKSGKLMLWDSGMGNLGETVTKKGLDSFTPGDRVLDLGGKKILFIGNSGWYLYSTNSKKWKLISEGAGRIVDVREFKSAENSNESGVLVISSRFSDRGLRYKASIIKINSKRDVRLMKSSIDLTSILSKKDIKAVWIKDVDTRTASSGVSILIAYSSSRKGTLTCLDLDGFGGGESSAVARWEDKFEKGFDPLQLRILTDGNFERLVMTDAVISYNREIGANNEDGCIR